MVSLTAMRVERSSLWFLQTTLIILYILDFLLTRHYLGHVGVEGEYNPLLRTLISSYGVDSILAVKVLALSGIVFCMFIIKPYIYKKFYYAMAALNFIMIAVAVQGLYVISTL